MKLFSVHNVKVRRMMGASTVREGGWSVLWCVSIDCMTHSTYSLVGKSFVALQTKWNVKTMCFGWGGSVFQIHHSLSYNTLTACLIFIMTSILEWFVIKGSQFLPLLGLISYQIWNLQTRLTDKLWNHSMKSRPFYDCDSSWHLKAFSKDTNVKVVMSFNNP